MTEQKILTEKGLKKIHNKLTDLMKNRKRLVTELEEARKQGDLAENSAYHELKNQLVLLEVQVGELQEMIDSAQVVADGGNSNGVVGLGSKVTVSYPGAKKMFELVGDGETDPLKGKISYSSPIARALINKKIGDEASVETPGGIIVYKIESVED